MVKNMVKDLSEEQLNIVLEAAPNRDPKDYVGKTLRDFVCNEMPSGDHTLTELMDMMENKFGLKWPFRSINVTVEVKTTRGFTLAVMDDETINAIAHGDVRMDEIDPNWDVDSATEEVIDDLSLGLLAHESDYAVNDDKGRCLVDWYD